MYGHYRTGLYLGLVHHVKHGHAIVKCGHAKSCRLCFNCYCEWGVIFYEKLLSIITYAFY